MIQRIQSVYLLLATASAVIMSFVPLGAIINQQTMSQIMFGGKNALPLMIIGLVIAVFSFLNIFLFRNRKLQIKITYACMFISVIFIGAAVFFLAINPTTKIQIPRPGIAFPLFALLFNVLAWRGIVHDEQLIKSMDRLR